MSPEASDRWGRVKELLADALERQGTERERFLDESCGGDAELRRELTALVAAHDRSGPLDRLSDEWIAPLLERAEAVITPSAEPPAVVGPYAIGEVIGAGGMGIVYRAHDVRLDRAVALKFLPSHLTTDPGASQRFLQEARAAAALEHPNICTVYEVGEAPDGRLFMAMPFYDGETLERRIARGPIPPGEAAAIALQVSSGIARAHDRGIIHRDLKPSNILLTGDGVVKVLDFGIAKLAGITRTATGQRLGTIAYMSPEQVRGRPVDIRADIWALGAVMYEMLTGRRPFEATDDAALVYAIVHESPPPLRNAAPSVPEKLESIVVAMLSGNPDARPATMRDVWELVAPHANAALVPPVSAHPARPRHVVGRGWSGRRIAAAAATGVLVLLLLAIGVFRLRPVADPAIDPNVIAVFPFAVVGGDGEYLREGMASLLATQLDGAASLRAVSPRALLAMTDAVRLASLDPRSAGELAGRFGAGTFILGDAAEVGGRIRLHATLYEAGSRRGESRAEGAADELFQLVDEMAGELLAVVKGGGESPSRIATLTTASLPAIKAYLSGGEAYRAERYTEAVDWYSRAVAFDSTFALGYYHLALAAQQTPAPLISQQAVARALGHAERLSPRDRRLVGALNAWHSGDYLAAANAYRDHLGAHPDEVEAWHGLGVILLTTNPMRGLPVSEAREPFERAAVLNPRSPFAVRHLVYVAAAERDSTAVDSLITRLDALGGRGDRWTEIEALRVAFLNDSAARRRFLQVLDTALDVQALMGTDAPLIFAGDVTGAEQGAQVLTQPSRSMDARSVGHSWLARLYAGRGMWRQAMQQIDILRSVDPEAALDTHAELASLAHAPVSREERHSLRLALEASPVGAVARSSRDSSARAGDQHWYYGPTRRGRPALRVYLAGMLGLLTEDSMAASRAAGRLANMARAAEPWSAMSASLSNALQAAILAAEGADEHALSALDAVPVPVTGAVVGAPLASLAPSRLLRAELLSRLGRDEDAVRWCTTVGFVSFYEFTYVVSAHRCAEQILTRLGRHEQAARHAAEIRRLWQGSGA